MTQTGTVNGDGSAARTISDARDQLHLLRADRGMGIAVGGAHVEGVTDSAQRLEP
jgi:hypothetical protein